MSSKLRCAVIGVGNMGKNHARIYAELPEVELVGVADSNETVGYNIAQQYNTTHYQDFQKMLTETKPNAVSICTPTSLHYDIGKQCIESGYNILMEKPIAQNVEQGAELLRLANDNRATFMVGHIERHNPAVKKVKEIIDNGELGAITNIIARRVGPFPPQVKDVNIAVDLAVHDIDIINYLIGALPDKIITNKRKTQAREHEDFVDFFLNYGETISAYIQTNWFTPVKIRKLNITGTEGYVELDYINQTLEFYKSTYEKQAGTPDKYSDYILQFAQPLKKEIVIEKKEPLKEELKYFVRAVTVGERIDSQYAVDVLSIVLN